MIPNSNSMTKKIEKLLNPINAIRHFFESSETQPFSFLAYNHTEMPIANPNAGINHQRDMSELKFIQTSKIQKV